MFKKTLFLTVFTMLFMFGIDACVPDVSASMVTDFLLEIANEYYERGNFEGALHELRKALLVQPGHEEAQRLIKQIEKKQGVKVKGKFAEQKQKEKALKKTMRKVEKRLKEEEAILPEMLKKEKKTKEEKKPIITAMGRLLPKPKPETASEWIIKPGPGETVTSGKLKDYDLFSGARVYMNSQEVVLSPVIIKKSDVWLPLDEVSRMFDMVLFSLGKNSYNLIRDDLILQLNIGKKEVLLNKGTYLTLKHPILKYEGKVMVDLKDLGELLAMEIDWDPAGKKIMIKSKPFPGEFTTFTMPKPEETKIEEGAKKQLVKKRPVVLGSLLKRIPPEVQPDIDINFYNYFGYSYNNLAENSSKIEQLRIKGDFYDYKFNSKFRWKDEGDKNLVEDSKFIGLYSEDTQIEFLDLGLNLSPFSQSGGYEGVKITTFHKPFTSKLYAGKRDIITISGPAEVGSVKYLGNILGIEQRYALNKINFKTVLLGMNAEAEDPNKAGTTSFARRNLVAMGDAVLRMPYDLTLSGQYALCNYYPDNMKHSLVQDNNWRVKARMDKRNISLRYEYEFTGNDYASLGNPEFYQDFARWNAYSRYRVSKMVSFYGGYNQWRDNVEDIDSQPTTKSKYLSIGSTLSLPTNTGINFGYSRGSSRTDKPGLDLTGSDSGSYRFNLFQDWYDLRCSFNYNHYEYDRIEDGDDYYSDSYSGSVSLYKTLPPIKGSYVRLRQSISRTIRESLVRDDSTRYTTSLNFKYYLSRDFSVYANSRLYNRRRDSAKDVDRITLRLGSDWKIDEYKSIGFHFNFAPYDITNDEEWNSKAWSAFLKLSYGFGISSPAKWGEVAGRVFIDKNGNALYDEGEEGLSNILVRIPKENAAQTDEHGIYFMEKVVPGEKTIKLDPTGLPIELASEEGFEKTVIVKSREFGEVDFAFIEYAVVGGRVFADENNNGIYDLGEEGIEDAVISLMPKFKTATSDENGRFVFKYVIPGVYKIQLNSESIPREYNLISPKELEVKLLPQGRISDKDFIVTVRPMTIELF
ncbi:MAG: SdrD B-like domain-containing protein [Candidatus Omnitrophota bacterium]|nr:SdrD B-like domain-containing protein [Candidatus Omnitrophota bacterium]